MIPGGDDRAPSRGQSVEEPRLPGRCSPRRTIAPVLRVITWNLNSIRTRRRRLFGLLERHAPDVLCLQELRAPAEVFPTLRLAEAGYHAVVHAQAARNGVAVIARQKPRLLQRGLPPCRKRKEARFLDCSVAGIRILTAYVPNGKSPRHPDWAYKLAWLTALRDHLDTRADPGEPLLLCGDFNVAPSDRDDASPNPGGVLCHPSGRSALARLVRFGLADAYRLLWPEGEEPAKGIYTWWDYTRLSFARNDGARIDHVYLTKPLAGVLRACFVDRDERRQRRGQDIPSDHAPVICDLAR